MKDGKQETEGGLRCAHPPYAPERWRHGSTLATGKDILFDDGVDAPVSIDYLGDAEIDADGDQRDRFILVSFLVVIRNFRILRNASRKARSTDDFE